MLSEGLLGIMHIVELGRHIPFRICQNLGVNLGSTAEIAAACYRLCYQTSILFDTIPAVPSVLQSHEPSASPFAISPARCICVFLCPMHSGGKGRIPISETGSCVLPVNISLISSTGQVSVALKLDEDTPAWEVVEMATRKAGKSALAATR